LRGVRTKPLDDLEVAVARSKDLHDRKTGKARDRARGTRKTRIESHGSSNLHYQRSHTAPARHVSRTRRRTKSEPSRGPVNAFNWIVSRWQLSHELPKGFSTQDIINIDFPPGGRALKRSMIQASRAQGNVRSEVSDMLVNMLRHEGHWRIQAPKILDRRSKTQKVLAEQAYKRKEAREASRPEKRKGLTKEQRAIARETQRESIATTTRKKGQKKEMRLLSEASQSTLGKVEGKITRAQRKQRKERLLAEGIEPNPGPEETKEQFDDEHHVLYTLQIFNWNPQMVLRGLTIVRRTVEMQKTMLAVGFTPNMSELCAEPQTTAYSSPTFWDLPWETWKIQLVKYSLVHQAWSRRGTISSDHVSMMASILRCCNRRDHLLRAWHLLPPSAKKVRRPFELALNARRLPIPLRVRLLQCGLHYGGGEQHVDHCPVGMLMKKQQRVRQSYEDAYYSTISNFLCTFFQSPAGSQLLVHLLTPTHLRNQSPERLSTQWQLIDPRFRGRGGGSPKLSAEIQRIQQVTLACNLWQIQQSIERLKRGSTTWTRILLPQLRCAGQKRQHDTKTNGKFGRKQNMPLPQWARTSGGEDERITTRNLADVMRRSLNPIEQIGSFFYPRTDQNDCFFSSVRASGLDFDLSQVACRDNGEVELIEAYAWVRQNGWNLVYLEMIPDAPYAQFVPKNDAFLKTMFARGWVERLCPGHNLVIYGSRAWARDEDGDQHGIGHFCYVRIDVPDEVQRILNAADDNDVFGLPQGFTALQAKKAYRSLLLQIHPDTMKRQNFPESRRPDLERATARLNRAFANLRGGGDPRGPLPRTPPTWSSPPSVSPTSPTATEASDANPMSRPTNEPEPSDVPKPDNTKSADHPAEHHKAVLAQIRRYLNDELLRAGDTIPVSTLACDLTRFETLAWQNYHNIPKAELSEYIAADAWVADLYTTLKEAHCDDCARRAEMRSTLVEARETPASTIRGHMVTVEEAGKNHTRIVPPYVFIDSCTGRDRAARYCSHWQNIRTLSGIALEVQSYFLPLRDRWLDYRQWFYENPTYNSIRNVARLSTLGIYVGHHCLYKGLVAATKSTLWNCAWLGTKAKLTAAAVILGAHLAVPIAIAAIAIPTFLVHNLSTGMLTRLSDDIAPICVQASQLVSERLERTQALPQITTEQRAKRPEFEVWKTYSDVLEKGYFDVRDRVRIDEACPVVRWQYFLKEKWNSKTAYKSDPLSFSFRDFFKRTGTTTEEQEGNMKPASPVGESNSNAQDAPGVEPSSPHQEQPSVPSPPAPGMRCGGKIALENAFDLNGYKGSALLQKIRSLAREKRRSARPPRNACKNHQVYRRDCAACADRNRIGSSKCTICKYRYVGKQCTYCDGSYAKVCTRSDFISPNPIAAPCASILKFGGVPNNVRVPHDPILFNPRSIGPVLAGVSAKGPPAVYQQNSATIYSAITTRVVGLRKEPRAWVRKEFRKFLEKEIPLSMVHVPTLSRYLELVSPQQRKKTEPYVDIFDEVKDRLSPKAFSYLARTFSAFVKRETGTPWKEQFEFEHGCHDINDDLMDARATRWQHAGKRPRLIQHQDPMRNLFLGPAILAIYGVLKKRWHLAAPISLGSGRDAQALGEWFDNNPRGARYVASDASCFDGRQDVLYFEELARLLKRVDRRAAAYLKQQQRSTTVCSDGQTFALNGGMKSGVPHTTLLNSLVNAFILKHSLLRTGKSGRIIVAGDDGLTAIGGTFSSELVKRTFSTVASECGHEYKISMTSMDRASFLASFPISLVDTIHTRPSLTLMFPGLQRLISKIGWTANLSIAPDQWWRDVAQGIQHIFSPFFITRGNAPKRYHFLEEHPQWTSDVDVRGMVPRDHKWYGANTDGFRELMRAVRNEKLIQKNGVMGLWALQQDDGLEQDHIGLWAGGKVGSGTRATDDPAKGPVRVGHACEQNLGPKRFHTQKAPFSKVHSQTTPLGHSSKTPRSQFSQHAAEKLATATKALRQSAKTSPEHDSSPVWVDPGECADSSEWSFLPSADPSSDVRCPNCHTQLCLSVQGYHRQYHNCDGTPQRK